MTISWIKQALVRYDEEPAFETPSPTTETAEFDEDGRRYVFRFPSFTPQQYTIDRERLFHYREKHKLPSARVRSMRRDERNAANFYEDVRDIQTHPDVIALAEERVAFGPVRRALPRLRRAETIVDFIEPTQNSA